MKRKLIAILLAGTMLTSLTACGAADGENTTPAADSNNTETGNAAAPETGTGEKADYHDILGDTGLNIVVNGTLTTTLDNGQAEFKEQWEEAVGIPLTIQQMDHSAYQDAVGRLFSSGDYPDAMIMSASMFKQYAPTGILWDMADAYDNADFQNRMILPDINKNLKDSEGRLYGFAPSYGNGCVTYVKQAWLDAVGIDINDIKTYDDYYAMLKAFHDGDPDGNGKNGDTYGVVAPGFIGTDAPYVNYLPEFWQDAYPSLLQGDDGVWYDGFQTEETKAALARLRQGYVDGCIDPESLTAQTKTAREKWFSNNQTGSSGVFVYWAGSWYQTLTDNFIKNDVDPDIVQLPPIEEVGAYINKEAPVWVIIDSGDPARNQAVFDALLETMMDGDVVQTLWTYGAEDVHWSTHAEEFVTNPGTENEKSYSYEEGEFHLKPSPNDPNSVWKKNYIDPALTICELTNGYSSQTDLAAEGNRFFTENSVDAPVSPVSETFTNETGTIFDAKLAVITKVVVEGGDIDEAMQGYVDTVGSIVDQCLAELNQ